MRRFSCKPRLIYWSTLDAKASPPTSYLRMPQLFESLPTRPSKSIQNWTLVQSPDAAPWPAQEPACLLWEGSARRAADFTRCCTCPLGSHHTAPIMHTRFNPSVCGSHWGTGDSEEHWHPSGCTDFPKGNLTLQGSASPLQDNPILSISRSEGLDSLAIPSWDYKRNLI